METKAKTDESISTLTSAFQKIKADLGLPKINSDQIDEHVFCSNLCTHARIASGLATEFIEIWKKGKTISGHEFPSLMKVFDPSVIYDPGHKSFSLWDGITLIVCFLVGYFGFPFPTESLIKHGSGAPLALPLSSSPRSSPRC